MPLVDTGLLVRYYVDEAASGTSPTTVDDASGNGYDLTIDYGSGNMSYSEPSANQRGLESTSLTGTQKARKAITSSDTIDALDGTKTCTIELVVRVDSFDGNSRVFGANLRDGATGKLILRGDPGAGKWRIAANDTTMAGNIGWDLSTRTVLHIVIDSAEAAQADRIKLFQDNVQDTSATDTMAQNTTFNMGAGSGDLIAFNRESSGSFDASFDGQLFYAAMYSGVLSSGDRTTNYNILTSNDDTPVAGGAASIIPQIMHHRKQLQAA